MVSFPITTLPFHLQQQIIKKLELRDALHLQKTSHWGLEAVDECSHPLFRSFSSIRKRDDQPLDRCFSKPWKGSIEEACNFRVCRRLMEKIQTSPEEFVEEKKLVDGYIRVWENLFRSAGKELANSCLQMPAKSQ